MAIAGDTHNIPSMPVKLVDGRVIAYNFSTNKPREMVEQDEEQAARRLLAGERFEMHCTELQIRRVQEIVNRMISEQVGQVPK